MHWNFSLGGKPSTKKLAQINKDFFKFLHGYLYLRFTPEYINFLDKTKARLKGLKSGPRFWRDLDNSASNYIAHSHHSKVLTSSQAQDLVTLEKEVHLTDLEQVLPFKTAKNIILKNPDQIVVTDCPCRALVKNPCQPLDVCLIVGEPLASFALEHKIRGAKKVSQDEAAFILEEERERGRIHTAWFKDALGDRFYAICNCCRCCCVGLKAYLDYQVEVVVSSGYVAKIGEECDGCGNCLEACLFETLKFDNGSLAEGKIQVDRDKCLGCGLCVDVCPLDAISLKLDPEKPRPLEVRGESGQKIASKEEKKS